MAIAWTTIRPKPVALGDPAALAAQVRASTPLRDLLRRASTHAAPILLLINDAHRATDTRWALAQVQALATSLDPRPRFEVLVAAGTHRFSSAEQRELEHATLAGLDLPIDAVRWHDATDERLLRPLAGVRLHERLSARDLLLPIGSVEPHYFAGVTGAHKTVTIGVMARADIEANHAHALDPASDVLELAGNPVYDGVARVVRALQAAGKTICAINEIVVGRELLAVAVGDPLATIDELLPTVRDVYLHEVARPADLLWLAVPMPLGRNFYQADKAFKNNHRAVRDGGGILLDAACPEGIGPDHFFGLLRSTADYASALTHVRDRGYRLGDHKAVKLRHLTERRGVRVALVSSAISDADAAVAGMRRFDTSPAALRWLAQEVQPAANRLRIEDAGFVSVRPLGA